MFSAKYCSIEKWLSEVDDKILIQLGKHTQLLETTKEAKIT